jgi:hypothetical protein
MKIVRQASFVATPRKNGGGITREAMRVPPVGDPLGWRVSVAQIDANGPFSDISGYHRKIVSQARHTVRVQMQRLDAAVTGAVLVENALGESAPLDPWDLAIGSPQDDGIHKLASVNAGEPARVLLARITDAAANNGRWNDSNVR